MKRILALTFCLLPIAGTLRAADAQELEKPNVVLFFVDDQSWVGTSVQMKPDDPETKSDFFETPALDDYLEKVNAEPALPERWGHRHLEKQGKPLPPANK